ncbi:hypothetical protein CYA_0557 [Synechococcus sp. JA-3-3Ab]|nr:hypothetical protein CYA_0557 [Synechococcus sp. JA-3-3Ab]
MLPLFPGVLSRQPALQLAGTKDAPRHSRSLIRI